MDFKTMDDILNFAIGKEEEAYNLYNKIAEQVKSQHIRHVFLDFARQEEGHKAKLLQVKAGKATMPSDQVVKDLKIGDHLVDIKVAPDLSYQEALIVAMKAEKNAYVMYMKLSSSATDTNLKTLFLGLASEEANHKMRFEMEYDDQFMKDN